MEKIFYVLFLLIFEYISAQQKEKIILAECPASIRKWAFWGYTGIGSRFGSSNYSIYASPRVGYRFTYLLEAGLVTNILWGKSNSYSLILGVGPYVNYYISRHFYTQALFQGNFINIKHKGTGLKYNNDKAALYLGAGYIQRIDIAAYLQIGGMYNVLYNKNKSVSSNDFIPNIGVVFHL